MMGTRHWRGGWVQGINLAFSQIKHPDKLIIGNFVKHSLGSGGFRGHNSPSRVTLTRVFLVGADLKSTRHLYTPASEALMSSTTRAAGPLRSK